MLFRVYDNSLKKWIRSNIYMNPDGELFKINQGLFGMVKVPMILDADRYIYHENINLTDKNGYEIFKGDYLRATIDDTKVVVGLVAYAHELSAYVILCVDSDEFFTLGSETVEYIEIIGNVFDGYATTDGSIKYENTN